MKANLLLCELAARERKYPGAMVVTGGGTY